jgi:hypothetical protein
VARSGLLDVPGARYIDLRLVCMSPSSASKKTSLDEEGEGVGGCTGFDDDEAVPPEFVAAVILILVG